MYKNQLQEVAQRSCFRLPSYVCTRQGPDHAPRFKASVNFNGQVFESPHFTSTLRQAEHSAAQVALNALLTTTATATATILDETGVYKNLLQETAHRAGLKLPLYTTVRSGPGHAPIFTCTVQIAGINFSGEPAKTKKQAQKNAAIAACSSLKTRSNLLSSPTSSRNAHNLKAEDYCKHPTRRTDQNQIHHHHHRQEKRAMAPPKPRPTSVLSLPSRQTLQLKNQRDEDQWLNNGKLTTPRNRMLYGRRSFDCRSSTSLMMLNQTHNYQCSSSMISNPQRMVPPIQIRSVIPVCSAPIRPPSMVTEAASATKHAPELNSVKPTSQLK